MLLLPIFFIYCGANKDKTTKALSKNKAVLEYKIDAKLGEGAFWNHKTQEFYWIDIEGKQLHIYNPETKTNQSLKTPSRIGTVVPIDQNEAIIGLEDGVHKINLKTGKSTLFSAVETNITENRLNDGKCDPSGRLWVGSMHLKQEKNKANLYTIDTSGAYKLKLDSITISNGIVWTSDKKTMYYIDTPTAKIKAYDYKNSTGEISNERIVVEVPESLGYPDGMAIDQDNMLWVGMWNGNAVIRFNPKTGKVLSKIEVPAHNVTACAFGGKNLDVLYITTARVDMTEEELQTYPLAGSIFKAYPNIKGVKSDFFKIN